MTFWSNFFTIIKISHENRVILLGVSFLWSSPEMFAKRHKNVNADVNCFASGKTYWISIFRSDWFFSIFFSPVSVTLTSTSKMEHQYVMLRQILYFEVTPQFDRKLRQENVCNSLHERDPTCQFSWNRFLTIPRSQGENENVFLLRWKESRPWCLYRISMIIGE